jgi:hypothetical protein
VQVLPNEPVDLNDGDVIKFGQYSSIYKFTLERYILTFSQIDKKLKHKLAIIAHDLNFIVNNQISSQCSHLVMERIYITAKVIVALGYGIPIVNVNWLTSLKTSKYTLDPSEYLPHISEDDLNCNTLYTKDMFNPNSNRRTLFKGLTFIYKNPKDITALSEIIEACSGTFKPFKDIEEIKQMPKVVFVSEGLGSYIFTGLDLIAQAVLKLDVNIMNVVTNKVNGEMNVEVINVEESVVYDDESQIGKLIDINPSFHDEMVLDNVVLNVEESVADDICLDERIDVIKPYEFNIENSLNDNENDILVNKSCAVLNNGSTINDYSNVLQETNGSNPNNSHEFGDLNCQSGIYK